MVGYKAGEFTWNRKPALYKAKQLRKKSKKNNCGLNTYYVYTDQKVSFTEVNSFTLIKP